jgi:Domain of Unknown Function (DUF1259)
VTIYLIGGMAALLAAGPNRLASIIALTAGVERTSLANDLSPWFATPQGDPRMIYPTSAIAIPVTSMSTPTSSRRAVRTARSARWRIRLRSGGVLIALGALLAGGCGAPGTPPPSSPPRASVGWNAVGRAMGSPLKTEEGEEGDVHTAEFLRTDLHVVNAGVTENPGMELGAEAMFHQTTPGTAVMIGEATVTSQELNTVLTRLGQDHTVEVTAIHKHLQDESPRL